MKRKSFIHAYGLFWRRDEINWYPGAGNSGQFRLLGRNGSNSGKVRVIDARKQCGIYILYGNYGPHYVGLTHKPLGWRLKQHLTGPHGDKWDRFSWFGFNPILKSQEVNGLNKIGAIANVKSVSPKTVIKDVEALLIRAMALQNFAQMNFASADRWEQIDLDEVEKYMSKV